MKICYKAYDGTIFDSELECKTYEKTKYGDFGLIFYCGTFDYALGSDGFYFDLDNLDRVVVEDYDTLIKFESALVVIIRTPSAYRMLVDYCNENLWDRNSIDGVGIWYYNTTEDKWNFIHELDMQIETTRKSLQRLHEEFDGRNC
jgi:hypothetical protein